MPNWCSTRLTFCSEREGEIKVLYEKLWDIYDGPPTAENGFGNGWLGDVANTFFPTIGADKISCRGEMSLYEEPIKRNAYWYFFIDLTTAWDAKIGMWYKIVREFYPHVKIAYIAEEGGCDYYVRWDESGEFANYQYFVELCRHEDDIEYFNDEKNFASLDAVNEWLKKELPEDFVPQASASELSAHMTDLLRKRDEMRGDGEESYFVISEYMVLHPSEFPL